MKLTLAVSLLPLLVQGNPVAASEAGSPLQLAPRADKWCRVDTKDVACRKGAGTGYAVAGRVQPSDNFGVHCKAKGEAVGEGSLRTDIWDWIPGWGCWVTAYWTNYGCEEGVPWC